MVRRAKRCRPAARAGSKRFCRLVLPGLCAAALAACQADDLDVRKAMMKEVAGPIPGTDQPYPNLASVPAMPSATAKAARDQLQKRLEADNKAKGYSPDRAAAPELPAPPPPLPEGFVDAQAPVNLEQAAAAAAASKKAGGSGPLVAGTRAAIVFFAAGSSEIDPGQVDKLRPLVERVRRQGGSLQLIGHAAEEWPAGGDAKLEDFDLSATRANALARTFVRLGLGNRALAVSAEGDSAPVPSLAGVSGAAANRRVDVFYTD